MAPALETSELGDGERLQVALPEVCREEQQTYTFSLTVYDGVKNSEPWEHDVTVQPNGPCEADVAEPGPDAGPSDVGGPELNREIGGSSCFCSTGEDRNAPVPLSLVGALLIGGLLRRGHR